MARHTKCVACELRSMCGMCPANGILSAEMQKNPLTFSARSLTLEPMLLKFPYRLMESATTVLEVLDIQ